MVTMGANSVRMCLQRFHTAIEVSKLHLALFVKARGELVFELSQVLQTCT